MGKVHKIQDNFYYFNISQKINKIVKTIILPINTKYDHINISILLDTITYMIESYNKYEFKKIKAENYNLIYSASFKELDSNLLVSLEVKFIDLEYLEDKEIETLVELINKIFKELYVKIEDIKLSISNHYKFMEKMPDNPTHISKILINDMIYSKEEKFLKYEETLAYLKEGKYEDILELLKVIKNSENYYFWLEGSEKTKEVLEKTFKNHIYNLEVYPKTNKIIDNNREVKDLIIRDNQVTFLVTYQYTGLELKDEYVLRILNHILGGSSSSKLFVNVREREHICYSIYSQDKIDFGIMILAEVDKEDLELLETKIDEQVEEIKSGNIKKELEVSKAKYINDIKSNRKKGYFHQILLDRNIVRNIEEYTIENIVNKVENITEEDIIILANKLLKTKNIKIN